MSLKGTFGIAAQNFTAYLQMPDAKAIVDYGVRMEQLGFTPTGDGRLEVGGAYLELTRGDPGNPERPLLNHIGVLVGSVDEHQAEAEELGVEIDDLVDAPNTLALFVWGPDRVKLEYIEHKPSFSLT